jgi:hypothetical protein
VVVVVGDNRKMRRVKEKSVRVMILTEEGVFKI